MSLIGIKGPRTAADILVEELQLEVVFLTQELEATQAELTATREISGISSFGNYGADANWGATDASVTSTDYGLNENWSPNPDVLHNSNYGVDLNWGALNIGSLTWQN